MKKEILIINNSKAIRFLLQTVMENEFEVTAVPDGYSAMRLLSQRNSPHLIVTDAQLPGMENWELIQQLSSNGIYNSIPVVALSGLDETETALKCTEYGVDRFFLKPFNPVELLTSINGLIENNTRDQYPPTQYV